jgi:hypothetical protein
MADETLASIVALREEGLSMGAIAQQLNDQGIATARGGQRWYASTVRSALRTHELDQQAEGAASA